MKISQEEIIVRFLWANHGMWVCSHELVKRDTEFGYLGSRSERRAFELAEQGFYNSRNFKYKIEHRSPRKDGNPTRFAQFRCSKREPLEYVMGLRNFSLALN